MGGGCFRAADVQVLEPGEAQCETFEPIELSSRAKVCFDEVVAKAGSSSSSSSRAGHEALQFCGVLRGAPTQEVSEGLYKWSQQGGKRRRSNLIQVLQSLIARLLDKTIVQAKEKLSSDSADLSFSSLTLKLTETLQVPEECRDGLRAACQTLQLIAAGFMSQPPSSSSSSTSANRARSDLLLSCVVPSLDSLVLIFRHALLSQINSSSGNLQGWRDFEEELGLPHLEHLPLLLGTRAKALFVGLSLVKDGVPPTTLVVSRTSPFEDARWQLSGSQLSILSCYFESEVGTKLMQGKRVEGGEGHGPRKEFFINTCNDVQSKWSLHQAEQGHADLNLRGNRLEASSEMPHVLANASPGDRINLRFGDSEAQELSRVVTGKLGASTLLVDKPFEEDEQRGAVTRMELHRACAPLFQFHRGTNQVWFGPYSTQLEHAKHPDLRDRYRRFGSILALALANHCKLGFTLPDYFFQFLLRRKDSCSLEDLRGFDDLLYTSLRKCLRMKQSQFEALREVEGLPPTATRELYVQQQVEATLCPPAMAEVITGFESCVGRAVANSVTPAELRQILCPVAVTKDSINIREVFDVIFEEEMAECPVFIEAFWLVIDKLNFEDKKRFLMFVTGLDTPPEPGTEQLRVQLPFSAFSQDEHLAMLDMLPQAHTCTNTLELPNYYEALKESGKVPEDASKAKWLAALQPLLKEKLSIAIMETGGYELDGGGLLEQSQSLGSEHPHSPPGQPQPNPGLRVAAAANGASTAPAAENAAEELDLRKPWVQQNYHRPNRAEDRQGAAQPQPTPVLLDRIHQQNSGERGQFDRDLVIQDSTKMEKHGVNELLDDLDTLLTTLG
eukprot:CAMPEP_0206534596 /NCGR_PEP_ID=MMETSP0325_2-20121206/5639_1 /ASSEMBLY_ACC=CAM_ASM_000347 /TAXON_ID=2866 /ORGANISM="Crypthecodinium cohnii, Strain Seligo" /LENGTH=842 /DNA_ID=CAMNT_0054031429 /DNA_START=102 /DNA_END=2630 /DNA_ORIENTATION=-